MWSKVVSTPNATFRAVGECKTKKLNEDRKRLYYQLTVPKVSTKMQRRKANLHHSKAESFTHGMRRAAMQMMFKMILLTNNSVN